VLTYLSRHTYRVAISNCRLIAADDNAVAFRWKDYRANGADRWKTMTLSPHEFIRRFLIHVLPKGLHRIRHYGLFAKGNRTATLARMRELLDEAMPEPMVETGDNTDPHGAEDRAPEALPQPCPCCGGRMSIIETFAAGCQPRYASKPAGVRQLMTPARCRRSRTQRWQ
jgi:hypothetical protein